MQKFGENFDIMVLHHKIVSPEMVKLGAGRPLLATPM